jgi:hypothetical protein
MARLRATASAARSVLDGREHDGMLGRIGEPIVKLASHQKERTEEHQKTRSRSAEDVLSHLPKLGIPMIMRRIEKGERKGDAKVWSYPGMEKAVQRLRKKIDGVSKLFTLDACRHGGMTELEEAELTDGQGRALSGHKTAQAYRGYAKETMQRALAATRKRHAHLLAQKQIEERSADETHQPEAGQKMTA